ncbi:MAG: XisI protein [Saprospiraceae bacterium]
MDKKLNYHNAIMTFLNEYVPIKPSGWKNVQNQLISDIANGHYQLVRVGWHNGEHIHYAVFHFDLVGDKVWIQQNRTDLPIVDELEALGVRRNDIVLAFQEPTKHQAQAS